MRRRNLIAGLVLIILGIGYAVMTSQLPTRNIENATGPSFFPWVVTTCFLALSFALFVQGFWRTISDRVPTLPAIPSRRWGAGLAVFVAYLLLLPWLGFLAANILLFGALMLLYGERRPLWVAGGALLVSLFFFFLFRDVFQIRLPAGILENLVT